MEEVMACGDCNDTNSSSSSEGYAAASELYAMGTCWPSHPSETHSESRKVKVELCRNYVENGYCIYAERCCFAHGYEELCRNTTLGPKLRTKQCRLFHKELVCKYGSRCNFIHQPKEQRANRIQEYSETFNLLTDYPELLLVKRTPRSILASLMEADC